MHMNSKHQICDLSHLWVGEKEMCSERVIGAKTCLKIVLLRKVMGTFFWIINNLYLNLKSNYHKLKE